MVIFQVSLLGKCDNSKKYDPYLDPENLLLPILLDPSDILNNPFILKAARLTTPIIPRWYRGEISPTLSSMSFQHSFEITRRSTYESFKAIFFKTVRAITRMNKLVFKFVSNKFKRLITYFTKIFSNWHLLILLFSLASPHTESCSRCLFLRHSFRHKLLYSSANKTFFRFARTGR